MAALQLQVLCPMRNTQTKMQAADQSLTTWLT
jgi:hypothetical protein